MKRWLARLLQFRRDDRGTLITEFALTMPMMMILMMGGAEVGRYMLINQKMDRAVTTMADLVSQEETMTTAKLTTLYSVVQPTMSPFNLGSNAVMIVSAVALDGTTPKVKWQRTGSGTLSVTSKIGVQGGTATLPTGMTVGASQTVIIAELYYNFTTLFVPNSYTVGLIENKQLYHRAFFRPRIGALDTIS